MEPSPQKNVCLPFAAPLVRARLVRRFKRFCLEALGPDGPLTAHTNNTGSMRLSGFGQGDPQQPGHIHNQGHIAGLGHRAAEHTLDPAEGLAQMFEHGLLAADDRIHHDACPTFALRDGHHMTAAPGPDAVRPPSR